MEKYKEILLKYWGFSKFRPLQEDIIDSVCQGKDTLGLMPTGGGKSITFQVPGLIMDRLCLVISPLIALMKDQVDNLRDKKIKAELIFSGLQTKEIDSILNKCIYGKVKFLYVSPERLGSELFIAKLRLMKINLIAIDESHCISQWGYDFRPSYLKICDIREILPNAPLLALTATATPEVVNDIQEKLKFEHKNVFQKSFYRDNLIYIVRNTEDKHRYLLRILRKVNACSIVYARSRRKTKEIAMLLKENNISAQFYHAGLDNSVKDYRQESWKNGEIQVIVSTNAFGMGIDKSNVRCVVHMDPPDTLEAYFQEAGRAGRDEKTAYAVMLYNNNDIHELKKRIATSFPEKKYISRVYEAMCNFLQVAQGEGKNRLLDFDLAVFCHNFKLDAQQSYNSLKILQRAGYIELSDNIEHQAKIHFDLSRDELYKYKLNRETENFIKTLLRNYTSLFTDYVKINTKILSEKLKYDEQLVKDNLNLLVKYGIIKYVARKKTPQIFFVQERLPLSYIKLNKEIYKKRKTNYEDKIYSVIDYCENNKACRSQILLRYFGEKNAPICHQCDVCKERDQEYLSQEDYTIISEKVNNIVQQKELRITELVESINHPETKVIETVRLLVDRSLLIYSEKETYLPINKNKTK